MVIKKNDDIKSSDITDQKVYLNRRFFMRGAVLAGSVAATFSLLVGAGWSRKPRRRSPASRADEAREPVRVDAG